MTATMAADDTVIETGVDDPDRQRAWLASQLQRAEVEFRATFAALTRGCERASAKVATLKQELEAANQEQQQAERAKQSAADRHQRSTDTLRGQLARYAPAAIENARTQIQKVRDGMRASRRPHPQGEAFGQRVVASAIVAADRIETLVYDTRPVGAIEAEVERLLAGVAAGTLARVEPELHPSIVELGQAITVRQAELRRAEYPAGDPRYARAGQEMLRLNEVRAELRELCLRPAGRGVGAEVGRLREQAGPGVGRAARREQGMIRGRERPAAVVAQDDGDYGG